MCSLLYRFAGLAHLGPLEDPVRVAARAVQTFEASKDAAAWASLPIEETIAILPQAKL